MVDTPDDSVAGEPGLKGSPVSSRRGLTGRRSLRSPNEALQPDTAPQPPLPPPRRRRRPIVAVASGILSFIGIAAIALAVAWSLGAEKINAAGPLTADKVVTIAPGTDVSGIVDQLADDGVIESRVMMTAALLMEGSRSSVKAGEYMFKQSASLQDVIDTLVSGKQILHSITIPEGLTSEQVSDRLRDNDVLVGDIKEVPKEGTLMPDTFKFARGTTREQLIRNMQTEQARILKEVWARRSADTPIRSPYDLVTLASIVEKETGRADERPRVAGVFVNRLTRNMPLQSDPTIVYGLVGGKGTLGRGILRSELEQKTPYNTYAITGLPPGPIANPGRAALEAVANPSRTKDLYFVADGTGGHAFADNLDQHRQNVQRWRQIEQDAKDKVAPGTTPAPSAPAANPPPKGNQRGDSDADTTAFGALAAAGIVAPSRPSSAFAAFPFKGLPTATPLSGRPGSPSISAYTGDGNFNELDVEVAGVRSRDDPQAFGDEGGGIAVGGDASQGGSLATFPVSPQRLADEKARALAYGLNPGSDHSAPPGAAPSSPPSEAAQGGPIHLYGKGKIIDASEGTSFDPLRDKSYDLTTAKVVPVIKALPPMQPPTTYAN